MPEQFDVLVVGAGVAGLQTARILAEAGQRVGVIEARDRIGGRIATRRIDSAAGVIIPVELGAEFIHGLPSETWNLVREAGLQTYELDGAMRSYSQGRLASADETADPSAVLEGMSAWLSRQRVGTDPTFADYLQSAGIDGDERRQAIRYVEGFNAADHRVIGVSALAQQQQAEDSIQADRLFHVSAGYDAIPSYLANRFVAAGGILMLERAVTHVDWTPGSVTVGGQHEAGTAFQFTGKSAVITLPLGVLQADTVRFSPRPTPIFEEVRRLAMGHVVRVTLLFRERFWPADTRFLFTDAGTPATWWTPNPADTPLLTGWVGGPNSTQIERAAIVDACIETLASTFAMPDHELRSQLTSWHFHDWSADPRSLGAYSYAPAGAVSAGANLARPVSRTLWFAGEHVCASGHWGTVHGALQSGVNAAAGILG